MFVGLGALWLSIEQDFALLKGFFEVPMSKQVKLVFNIYATNAHTVLVQFVYVHNYLQALSVTALE